MTEQEIKQKIKDVKDINGLFELFKDEKLGEEKFSKIRKAFTSYIAEELIEIETLINEVIKTAKILKYIENMNEN